MTVENLYEEYYTLLKRFANSLTSNEHDASDLVQDTFMRALANLQLLEMMPAYKRKSWLFTVLKNLFIDKKRRAKLEQMVSDQIPHAQEYEMAVHSEIPLEALPEYLRDIVYKRYWMNMNSSEIGKELNIPAPTVRYKLREAIKILRKHINK